MKANRMYLGAIVPDTGFDCSGIVQYAYSKIGIKLSRTAQNQYDQSTKITASEAKAGDLVFFTGTYHWCRLHHTCWHLCKQPQNVSSRRFRARIYRFDRLILSSTFSGIWKG